MGANLVPGRGAVPSRESPLLFKCAALEISTIDTKASIAKCGECAYGLCTVGRIYSSPRTAAIRGRGMQISYEQLGPVVGDAAFAHKVDIPWFLIESDGSIRLSSDPGLSLAVNHSLFVAGTPISLWGTDGRPAWACKFTFNASDSTISPAQNSSLCLGIGFDKDSLKKLVLVERTALELRCVFLMPSHNVCSTSRGADKLSGVQHLLLERLNQRSLALVARKRSLDRRADAYLTQPDTLAAISSLKTRGFLALRNVVDADVVQAAVVELNKMMEGKSGEELDPFKGEMQGTTSTLTAPINDSILPRILQVLLGGEESMYERASCQIALRFPGDGCPAGTRDCSDLHFHHVTHNWHIDGFPSHRKPGVSDHFGEIRNFDALVGILLRDVVHENAGELVVLDGGHNQLANFFKMRTSDGVGGGETNLDLARESATLPNGMERSKRLHGEHPRIHRCLGRAGDVFIANYLTPHLVAPNTGENIRYALYYRVKGTAWGKGENGQELNHVALSMYEPWVHWLGLQH